MTLLFGRTYSIQIDDLGVESLRVGFTVKKSLKKTANTAEIAVYNLAKDTRKRLEGMSAVAVQLFAGYDGVNSLIFRGELRDVFSRWEENGSWVTVLRGADGDAAMRTARTNYGQRPGVSVARVVQQLATDLGVGIGNAARAIVSGNLEGVGNAFGKGVTMSGSTQEQLDKILRSAGKEWSIQDGELQVIDAGAALQASVTVLSPITGLMGTPEVQDKGANKGKAQIRCRILPDLNPGRAAAVESATVIGVWRIDEVTYTGDTHGQDWTAEIMAREAGLSL
jgi:hypothetical protein